MLQFPSYDKAPCMARPALFVSGLADTLVPPRMMTILSQRCGSIYKQLLCFETGSHNETWTCPGYYHALNTFLQDLRSRSHGSVAQSAPMPRPPAPDQDTL
jgi:abhydrolase domain-containing protein 13